MKQIKITVHGRSRELLSHLVDKKNASPEDVLERRDLSSGSEEPGKWGQ